MKLSFSFDNKNWFTSDVSKVTKADLNKAIWILFGMLNCKTVCLEKEVKK